MAFHAKIRATIAITSAKKTKGSSNIWPPGGRVKALTGHVRSLVAILCASLSAKSSNQAREAMSHASQQRIWHFRAISLRSAQVLFQIELERPAFDGHAAGAHFVEGAQHPALAPQRPAGEADDQPVGRSNRGAGANLPGDLDFVAMRIERASRGKGARRRAADTGIAMHHHRCAAVPATDEIQDPLDMMICRRDKTVHLLGDVVHRHPQMIGLEHRSRALHLIDIGHYGEDVAGAGGSYGLGKCGKRTDVKHGDPSKRSLEGPVLSQL